MWIRPIHPRKLDVVLFELRGDGLEDVEVAVEIGVIRIGE
jgi:hypothetical protein